MNGELLYAHSPRRSRFMWAAFYVAATLILVAAVWWLGSRYRTRIIPVGQITLSVPYSEYLVGEPVSFTIKNNFNSAVFISNDCPAEPLNVYRQENGQWIRVHDTASISACAGQSRQITIPANGSVNSSFGDWPNLFTTPGNYRVVAYVEYYGALPYQDFQVIARPPTPTPTPKSTPTPKPTPVRVAPTPTPTVFAGPTPTPTPRHRDD